MRRRAGRRARAKYEAQRKAWLRRKRGLWFVSAVVFVGIWLFIQFVWAALFEIPQWLSPFIAGILVSLFIGVRQSPPGGIANWQEGAFGEERTAKQLARIRKPGWTILNDLSNGRYNFDHVVIGPPGVFCLNSKSSIYRLDVDNDGRLIGTNMYDEDMVTIEDRKLAAARREAVDLKNRIESLSGRRVWVQPVIVWWGQFPEGGKTVDGVAVVQGAKLAEKLLSLPEKRTTDIAAVIDVLKPGRRRLSREG